MSVSASYNGTVIPNIIGRFDFHESYDSIGFTCNFLVKADTAAALVTACANLESKFREPYENLTLSFSGSAEYSFNHDDNTCLNPEVSIRKSSSRSDNATSRMYQFNFVAGLPADKAGFDFRRKGDFSINVLPTGKRQVSFTLEYTASPSPDATSDENFDSHAEDYAEGVLSAIFSGIVFDLDGNIQKSQDQERKVTTGVLVYTENFEPESLVATNDPKLKNVQCSYSVARSQRIGVSSAGYIMNPVTNVRVSYRAELVKSGFTTNDEVNQYYNTNIKPHMITRALINLNLENTPNASGNIIVDSDNFEFDPVSYNISGNLSFTAPETVTSIVMLEESVQEKYNSGIVTQKLWDGEEFTKAGYHMGAEADVVRNITVVQIGVRPHFPSLFPQQDLVLMQRIRNARVEVDNSNTEVGAPTTYFIETFTEIYEKCSFVENLSIPVPAQITTPGGE